MKLYHGSDILIEEIDFEKSKPFKDFGKGFYLSAEYEGSSLILGTIMISYMAR